MMPCSALKLWWLDAEEIMRWQGNWFARVRKIGVVGRSRLTLGSCKVTWEGASRSS